MVNTEEMTMNKLVCLSLLAAPLALSACAPSEPQPDMAAIEEATPVISPEDPCGAANYQQFVGETSPQISLPAGTEFRHYRSGDPVTTDLMPTRVNFEYDRSGKLAKVSCG